MLYYSFLATYSSHALAHLFHAKTPIDLMFRARQAVLRYPLGSLGRFVTAQGDRTPAISQR